MIDQKQKREIVQCFLLYLENYADSESLQINAYNQGTLKVVIKTPAQHRVVIIAGDEGFYVKIDNSDSELWSYDTVNQIEKNYAKYMAKQIIGMHWIGEI